MRLRRRWFFLPGIALAMLLLPHVFPISPSQLRASNSAVTFEDRSGIPLGTILGANSDRTAVVPLNRVSPFFQSAIIAAEDRRFYRHGGVDFLALSRAGWDAARCLCNAGGASTIPMQVARMRFALPDGIRGKLLQIWDAERIADGSGKSAILEAYVNRVAMGGNIYGVEAAARTYFGIPASDLDLAQSALLAGIPNDPVRLDPRAHWNAARARQRYVLNRLVQDGVITRTQAVIAARENIHVVERHEDLIAAQQLLFRLASSSGTNRIRTTVDLPLQRYVQAQAQDVVEALADRNVTQASALVIDNRTGDVLAYLGSLDYFDDAYQGRNDGVQALRQPGSTLKPFLYEYALERGAIRADTVLADVPTSYAIPGGEAYSPEDYSRHFAGPVSVRTALANSLNVPAVRVLSTVGVSSFLDRLRALGFERLRRSPEYYGLGLTLGAGEVTLWDLAHAYVTLSRGGNAISLRTDLSVPPDAGVQMMDRSTAQLITDILADRYARARAFGIGSVIDMPFPVAVKTGTSSDYRDTWTVGYTPEYTVAVWVGNFNGAPMRRIAGVTGAGPLWNRIMLHLYEHRDPPRFDPPPPALLVASHRLPRSTATRDAAFDEWRAEQDNTAGQLHILFPHDGDVFEDNLSQNDTRRSGQQIAFRISRPSGSTIAWSMNGVPLASSSRDVYYWTVRSGTWTLSVSTKHAREQVRFTVVRGRPQMHRGFVIGPVEANSDK
jgi:penicillin-binding protein 1C